MNWSSLAEFAAMGGYGVYVWGSFGVTALAMVGELLALRARRKALQAVDDEAPLRVDYRSGTPHEA